jgi:hypothetical protein
MQAMLELLFKRAEGRAMKKAAGSLRSHRSADRTPQYEALIHSIVSTAKEIGPDGAERAVAEALSELRLLRLSEAGWKRFRGRGGLRRVADPRKTPNYEAWPLWATDHLTLWQRDGEVIGIAEPYSIHTNELPQLRGICERLGIEVSIDQQWAIYFPGRTTALIYTRPGVSLRRPGPDTPGPCSTGGLFD